MALRVTTRAHIESGDLVIHHKGRFLDQCAEFKGTIRLTAEKDTRSLQQNGLYWVWNGIVGREKGYDPEDVHAINKDECNQKHVSWVDKKTGEILDRSVGGSTARLSVDAFSEFMERVQRFWSEQGVDLPGPDEQI